MSSWMGEFADFGGLCLPARCIVSCWAGQSWGRGGCGLCGGPGGQQSLALPEKSVPSRDEVGGEPTPAMRFCSGLSVFVQKTLIN